MQKRSHIRSHRPCCWHHRNQLWPHTRLLLRRCETHHIHGLSHIRCPTHSHGSWLWHPTRLLVSNHIRYRTHGCSCPRLWLWHCTRLLDRLRSRTRCRTQSHGCSCARRRRRLLLRCSHIRCSSGRHCCCLFHTFGSLLRNRSATSTSTISHCICFAWPTTSTVTAPFACGAARQLWHHFA